MKLKLIYLDSFTSEFKGKQYEVSQFIDPTSLTIISGSNLNNEKPFIKGEKYDCIIGLKSGKLKVFEILA